MTLDFEALGLRYQTIIAGAVHEQNAIDNVYSEEIDRGVNAQKSINTNLERLRTELARDLDWSDIPSDKKDVAVWMLADDLISRYTYPSTQGAAFEGQWGGFSESAFTEEYANLEVPQSVAVVVPNLPKRKE